MYQSSQIFYRIYELIIIDNLAYMLNYGDQDVFDEQI